MTAMAHKYINTIEGPVIGIFAACQGESKRVVQLLKCCNVWDEWDNYISREKERRCIIWSSDVSKIDLVE